MIYIYLSSGRVKRKGERRLLSFTGWIWDCIGWCFVLFCFVLHRIGLDWIEAV